MRERARRPRYGKVFWFRGGLIREKAQAQRPFSRADSSLELLLKREADTDAKKAGEKGNGGRERNGAKVREEK